jgi:hypothetical protein
VAEFIPAPLVFVGNVAGVTASLSGATRRLLPCRIRPPLPGSAVGVATPFEPGLRPLAHLRPRDGPSPASGFATLFPRRPTAPCFSGCSLSYNGTSGLGVDHGRAHPGPPASHAPSTFRSAGTSRHGRRCLPVEKPNKLTPRIPAAACNSLIRAAAAALDRLMSTAMVPTMGEGPELFCRKRHQSKESGSGMHDHLRRNSFEVRSKTAFLLEARPEFRTG